MGLFSKIKKALKFEAFNVKGIIKKIAKNPQRLLVGAVDPIGTKLANTVLGTKWKPAVNQLGGATKETFDEAKAKGMDVGLAKSLHAIAGTVAGIWGGAALGSLAGKGISQVGAKIAGSATEAGSVGAGAVPVTTTAAEAGAAPASAAAQSAAGIIEPVTTTVSKVGTTQAGGLLSKAADVGKGVLGYAKSNAGQTLIAGAMQGYAKGKEQEAEFKQQDKYRREFTPEELAKMNGGGGGGNAPAPGGYLDRARRVSEFLGDRGTPVDPATVAGYARGEF